MKRDSVRRMIILSVCAVIAAGIVALILITPGSGLDTGTAKNEILKHHVEFTGAENAVSAIYLNIRLWDTLFEALVLLVSAVAVISFSRSDDHER